MGSSSSKVPVSSLKVLSKKQTIKNTKNLVLNPRLCQSIFHATEGYCCAKEVQPFKKFLLSESNLKPDSMSKKKVLENELIKLIDLPSSEIKLLSPDAANYLEEVLVHLKSQTNDQKPYLISRVIEPKLEDILIRNKALK